MPSPSIIQMGQLIGSIISQLASGVPFWKISVPTAFCTDYSLVEGGRRLSFGNKTALETLGQINSEQDPIKRLSLAFSSVICPIELPKDKPLNPIVGEFTKCSAIIDDERHTMFIEQVSHHPPMSVFIQTGANFRIFTPKPVCTGGSIKLNISSLELLFEEAYVRFESESGTVMEWQLPFFRIENLLTKRITMMHGPIRFIDRSSGYELIGTINRGQGFVGRIHDMEGTIVHELVGNVQGQINFKGTDDVWMNGLSLVPFEVEYDEETLNDPMVYSA